MYNVIVTGANLVAAELATMGAVIRTRESAIVSTYGAIYQTRVRAAASGRPGPRAITGNYRRSISLNIRRGPTGTVAEVFTNAPQARRLEFGFAGADSLGRQYCVDEETEALTDQGWRRFSELAVGDRVLTLNPDTCLAEWQPINALWVYPGPNPVWHIEGRTLSAMATADHRWLVERYYGRQQRWIREWRTTETVPPNARVPLVQKCSDLPSVKTYDDDLVELTGWFWTEGSYDWSRQWRDGVRSATSRPINLRISQSPVVNPDNCDRIARLLGRLFGPQGTFAQGAHWNVRPQANGTITFNLDRVACWLMERTVTPPNKALLPSFLTMLTQDQLDLLIDVSLAADGHTDSSGVTKLSQSDESRIRAFEMACVLAGRPVVTRHRLTPEYERWETTLLRTAWSHAFGSALRKDRDHSRVERVVHNGIVWCPTTASGTWLARRHGTVYFTGNSQPPYPHWEPPLERTTNELYAALAAAVPA